MAIMLVFRKNRCGVSNKLESAFVYTMALYFAVVVCIFIVFVAYRLSGDVIMDGETIPSNDLSWRNQYKSDIKTKDVYQNKSPKSTRFYVQNNKVKYAFDALKSQHPKLAGIFGDSKGGRGVPALNLTFRAVNARIYVYSAFYDTRVGRVVRIVTIAASNISKSADIFCLFGSVSTNASVYKTCESHDKPLAAFVLSCSVPNTQTKSSLQRHGIRVSDGTSSVKVTVRMVPGSKMRSKRSFNVCVPPLFGDVSPIKLIEFIEVTKLLGADHFTFYSYKVREPLRNVLRLYEQLGTVTVLPWKLPTDMTSVNLWYNGQSASAWDCLFRSVNAFQYVAFNDLDEFIFPKGQLDWSKMTDYLEKKYNTNNTVAGYRFSSSIFDYESKNADEIDAISDISHHLVTLNATSRTYVIHKHISKLIVDPGKVFEVGVHHLSKPLYDGHFSVDVSPEIAFVHHYRKCRTTFGIEQSCDLVEIDYSMVRYRSQLLENIIKMVNIFETFGQPIFEELYAMKKKS